MDSNYPDSRSGMYQTADGRYEWCMFCHKKDVELAHNMHKQCQNKMPRPHTILYDSDKVSNVQWCSDQAGVYFRGKPPKCPTLEFPNHTDIEVSDPDHKLYTHTNLTITCKEGYIRYPWGEPETVSLTCLSTRRWTPSLPDNFRCVPSSSIKLLDQPTMNITTPENIGLTTEATVALGICFSAVLGIFIISVLLWRYVQKKVTAKCSEHDELEESRQPFASATESRCTPLASGNTIPAVAVPLQASGQLPVNTEKVPADHCTCLLSELEIYDKGNVHREVVEKLDPASLYGRDKSWVALAKDQGYPGSTINYIHDKKKDDMFHGPTAYVLQGMVQNGRMIGDLVKFLDSIGQDFLIKRIRTYHMDCPYCDQFIQ